MRQGSLRPLRQCRCLAGINQCTNDIEPTSALPDEEFLQARCSNPPRWYISDPAKTHTVIWLVDKAQIGQDILNLLTIIKSHSTNQLVRHTLLIERPLEGIALGIGTVQDSKVAIVALTHRHLRSNLAGNGIRLLCFIISSLYLHWCTWAGCRPERFIRPLLVFIDHIASSFENSARRAIILLELHHQRPREIALEVENIRKICATPAIDRLPVISYHADIAA